MLMADLSSLRVPLAELCLQTRSDPVTLTHWDTLQGMIFRPTSYGGLCTAVVMNMSNYAFHPTDEPEKFIEPIVEVSFLTDNSFPFSTSSREEIMAEIETLAARWQGHGDDFHFYEMSVVGLARINSAVEHDESHIAWRTGQRSALADYTAQQLAELLRTLRYHQAVKRHLDQDGLARRIPVIVGSRGVGPFIEVVYYPAPSRESAAEAEARMTVEWKAQRRAEMEKELWRTAKEMRELRRNIRDTLNWPPPHPIDTLCRFYETKEALIGVQHPLGPPRQTSWRIVDDAEYERFLKWYYVDAYFDD